MHACPATNTPTPTEPLATPALKTATPAPLVNQDAFVHALKDWVRVDDQIAHHSKQLRELRGTRNALTPSICNYMERTNNCDLKVQVENGELCYGVERVHESFTQKMCLEGLVAYFRDVHHDASAEDRAAECLDFIKRSRTTDTRAVLRRRHAPNATE